MNSSGMRLWGRINRRRWALVRRAALDRDGWRCVRCSRAGALEVDHIRPLAGGGDPYALDNLQALCRGCHVDKSNVDRGIVPLDPAWTALVDELTAS